MISAALFNSLTDRRFTFRAEGDKLFVEPMGKLDEDDKAAIRACKAELLAFVSSPLPLPTLREDGSLRIPLNTHPQYLHWAGGQSLWATLAELSAGLESWKRYGYEGLMDGDHKGRCKGEVVTVSDFSFCVACGYYGHQSSPAQQRAQAGELKQKQEAA